MKITQNMKHKLGIAATVVVILGGMIGMTLANGGATDPLITLSYLQESVTPDLEAEAATQVKAGLAELEATLDREIATLKDGLSDSSTSGSSHFLVVTLSKGQELRLDIGTQVVLRVGAVTVNASGSPALVNLTQGSTINSGSSLNMNQLYLATIENRSLIAIEDTVKVMVAGGYTIV